MGVEIVEEFGNKRKTDQDRSQNLINKRFPSLAEARDAYLRTDNLKNSMERSGVTSFTERSESDGSFDLDADI